MPAELDLRARVQHQKVLLPVADPPEPHLDPVRQVAEEVFKVPLLAAFETDLLRVGRPGVLHVEVEPAGRPLRDDLVKVPPETKSNEYLRRYGSMCIQIYDREIPSDHFQI